MSNFVVAKGVEESALEIQKTREEVLDAFEYHVTRVSPHRDMPLRLSNLLLLLPPIMAIARDLVEEAQLAKLFGRVGVLFTFFDIIFMDTRRCL